MTQNTRSATPADRQDSQPIETVSQVVHLWRKGEADPDARAEIERRRAHGEVTKDEFVDLVYEEFAALVDRGVEVDPQEFLHRFPTYRRSIRRVLEVHGWMHDVETELQQDWPEPGEQVYQYLLTAKLGEGGCGRVFRARNQNLAGRSEVVKITRDSDGREAHIMSYLAHDHIVPVHNVIYDDARTLIAMPYCGRATLAHVIDALRCETDSELASRSAQDVLDAARDPNVKILKPPMLNGTHLEAAVELARQMSSGLAHAHKQQMIHGDIKPSNVLVTPWGQAMLLDFNLSGTEQEEFVFLGGTLPYLAPELLGQVRRDEKLLDRLENADRRERPSKSTDTYSLGIVLYELFTGVYPFGNLDFDDSKVFLATLTQRQLEPLKPVQELNPKVDDVLCDVIHQCLDPIPENRPASAREVELIFQQWQLTQEADRQRQRAIDEEKSRLAAEDRAATAAALSWWRWGSWMAVVVMATAATTSSIFVRQNSQAPSVSTMDSDLVLRQIREHYLLGENDEAVRLTRDALKVTPENPDLNSIFGYLMAQMDPSQRKKYVENFRLACQDTYDAAAWNNYAYIIRTSDSQLAYDLLLDAIAQDGRMWEPHFLIGMMTLKQAKMTPPLFPVEEGAAHMVTAFNLMKQFDQQQLMKPNLMHYQYAIHVLMLGNREEDLYEILKEGIANGLNLDKAMEGALNNIEFKDERFKDLIEMMKTGTNYVDPISPLIEPNKLRKPRQVSPEAAERKAKR